MIPLALIRGPSLVKSILENSSSLHLSKIVAKRASNSVLILLKQGFLILPSYKLSYQKSFLREKFLILATIRKH